MSQVQEGISFTKVTPVRRQSEQSVLSSLSLKSNMHRNMQKNSISNTNNSNNIPGRTQPSTSISVLHNESVSEKTSASVVPSNIGVQMPFTTGQDKLASKDEDNNNENKDDAYDTDDNDTDDANNKAHDLTQQALRKLSFLKFNNNDNNTDSELNSPASSKQSPAPQPPGSSQGPVPQRQRDNSNGGIKQVSSFLNSTTSNTTNSSTNLSSNSSSSSMSSNDTMRNSRSMNYLRQVNNLPQQQQQTQFQQMFIQGKGMMPQNTGRSIMKSSSSSILFNKSASNNFMNNNVPRIVSNQHVKQINNPKRPMYVPAVLRNVSETNLTDDDIMNLPTAISQSTLAMSTNSNRSNSLTPTSSQSSSYLLGQNNRIDHSQGNDLRSNTPLSNSLLLLRNPDSRQNHGAPKQHLKYIKTSHWVPDSMRHQCKECQVEFNMWERKHHCRHCGEIYCRKHLQHKLYLDFDAQFITTNTYLGRKFLSKVCDSCHLEYEQVLIEMKSNQTNSANNNNNSNNTQRPRQLIIQQRNRSNHNNNNNSSDNNQPRNESVVGSVPVDWNWSSF